MQCLKFIIFIVSEKIATLKFLPYMDNWPSSPTLIIAPTHIFTRVKKMAQHMYLTGALVTPCRAKVALWPRTSFIFTCVPCTKLEVLHNSNFFWPAQHCFSTYLFDTNELKGVHNSNLQKEDEPSSNVQQEEEEPKECMILCVKAPQHYIRCAHPLINHHLHKQGMSETKLISNTPYC